MQYYVMQIVNIDHTVEGAQEGHLNVPLGEGIEAYIDESILYDLDPTKNDLVPCTIIGFRAAAGLHI